MIQSILMFIIGAFCGKYDKELIKWLKDKFKKVKDGTNETNE